MVERVKIFQSSGLITEKNYVAICHTVWTHVGGRRRTFVGAGAKLIEIVPDPVETRSLPTRVIIPNLVCEVGQPMVVMCWTM